MLDDKCKLVPPKWGWTRLNGLMPTPTDRNEATANILKFIQGKCKNK